MRFDQAKLRLAEDDRVGFQRGHHHRRHFSPQRVRRVGVALDVVK